MLRGLAFFCQILTRPAGLRLVRASSTSTLEASAATGKAGRLGLEDLMRVNAHLGHKVCFVSGTSSDLQKGMWNPKMKPFIFGTSAGVHILDLEQTLPMLERALQVAKFVDVILKWKPSKPISSSDSRADLTEGWQSGRALSLSLTQGRRYAQQSSFLTDHTA